MRMRGAASAPRKPHCHRTDHESSTQISRHADTEGLGCDFVARRRLQILSERPTNKDGKQRIATAESNPMSGQNLHHSQRANQSHRLWDVNSLGAAGKPLRLPQKNNCNGLEH